MSHREKTLRNLIFSSNISVVTIPLLTEGWNPLEWFQFLTQKTKSCSVTVQKKPPVLSHGIICFSDFSYKKKIFEFLSNFDLCHFWEG